MQYWLDQTRMVDASNLLQSRGAMPATLDRFGGFNFQNLAPDSDLDVAKLFAPKGDAQAYLSEANADAAHTLASRELTGKYGPPIYDMSFDEYEDEVLSLSETLDTAVPISSDDEFGDVYSAEDAKAFARYNELVPPGLVPADGDFSLNDLWLDAQAIAQAAGLHGG
jgi:hypothetical protein